MTKKNDKLLILDGNFGNVDTEKLIKAFKEELKPVGATLKSWAKSME